MILSEVIHFSTISIALLWVLMLGGLAILFFAGESLTHGAVGMARKMNIPKLVIGLTIVSIATSMPEMIASLFGALQGNTGMAIGNLVGSNITNLGLILGLSTLLLPIKVEMSIIKKEMPILILVSFLFWFFANKQQSIDRFEGIILLAIMLFYITHLYCFVKKKGNRENKPDEFSTKSPPNWSRIMVCLVLGSLGLALGADLVVQSAVEIAHRFGVSDFLIGITIIAFGTSCPELVACITAAIKKHPELVAGNVIGSNIFNLLLIGGTVSTITTLPIKNQWLSVEFPLMIGITFLSWLFLHTKREVNRLEGSILLLFYIGSMAASFLY